MKRRCQALYWIKKGAVQIQCSEKSGKTYDYWGDREMYTYPEQVMYVKAYLCKKHSKLI